MKNHTENVLMATQLGKMSAITQKVKAKELK
jgi:hypothetical protein